MAFAPDFQNVLDWPRFAVDRPPLSAIHDNGKYLVFINRVPPAGATEFPTGTMIVKIPQGRGDVFAMAKRGQPYNARGALGWEWFELKSQPDGSWTIAWRGITPTRGVRLQRHRGGRVQPVSRRGRRQRLRADARPAPAAADVSRGQPGLRRPPATAPSPRREAAR